MRRGPLLAVALVIAALVLAVWWRRPVAPAARPDLVIALAGDPTTLDPHMTANVAVDLSLLSHLYPALVVRDAQMRLVAGLARSWRQVDSLRWRFQLQPDARFENGEPIDAAAVVWNFNRIRDPSLHARIGTWFKPIRHMTAIAPDVLEVVTAEPFPGLPAQVTMLFLLPPRWTATHQPARETLSGGPYRLAAHVPGSHSLLVRNPRYWGPPAAFASVDFRIVPSPTARMAALLAGETDLITALPLPQLAELQGRRDVKAGAIASNRSVFIKINTLKPPLNDLRVRQALNYAIDKVAIADGLFDGRAPLSTCQLLTPDYVGFNPALKPYPYNPARARALLAAAGARNLTLTLETPSNNALQGSEVTQTIAAQLGAVGVQIRLVQLENGFYMDKFLKGRALGDLSILTHAWPTMQADGVLSLFQSDSPYAYYRDPALDRLLPQARAAIDPARQQALYAQITSRFCRQAPGIFLYTQPTTYAASRRITWQARGDDWMRATDIVRH